MNNTNTITFKEAGCKDENASVWLVSLIEFGKKLGLFDLFEGFKLKMKTVNFTVNQKLMVIIMSIAIGCETTSAINDELRGEKLALDMFDMDRCPDQSQINEVLRRFDEGSIKQLEEIHDKLFMENSKTLETEEESVVDFDQTGLIANGQSFELAEKGYFSKQDKGKKGYQMLAAYEGGKEIRETVGMKLDTGNTHCTKHQEELLKATVKKYEKKIEKGQLTIRTDSGFGTAKIIEMMEKIKGLKFLTKAYSPIEAGKIGRTIEFEEWTEVGYKAWVYEIEDEGSRLRHIIVKVLTKKMEYEYAMLITNIKKGEKSAEELFHFYNERQTIEAFFKMAKNVYHIKNLRTRKFYGIYGFLWIVFITHNIISLFKGTMFAGTELEDAGMKVFVEKVGKIKGFVERLKESIEVRIPKMTKISKLLAGILCNRVAIRT
ncbi:MAG: transposase [Oscillospiraceae bacterium]|nr:transposase [Oscillospiraceae bacterium]